MSLEAAFLLPHPPVAVPAVGRGREEEITPTIEGFRDISRRIAEIGPDTVVIISPHAAYYADWIYIASGEGASGSLASFGAPQERFHVTFDRELRGEIEAIAAERGIPAGEVPSGVQPLDHGTMVPLHFVNQELPIDSFECVLVGGSALPRGTLLGFGACIADACAESGSRCVLLVSGDLSHKLEDDGPYGFDPAGPVFEKAFIEVVESGDPTGFARIDRDVCEDAAECGLSGLVMMAGALERTCELSGKLLRSELLSHEGPFGVGYGVAAFELVPDPETVAEAELVADAATIEEVIDEAAASEDALVALAEQTIRSYTLDGMVTSTDGTSLPDDLPERAGCFVSIHRADGGELRGCIGTIAPTQPTLADEVVMNAVSASTRDPRFPPITPDEVDGLEVNVDVLYPPEPSSLAEMDPNRYGIIVEKGMQRGLLLPDLEGVDTVEDQYRIACMKAGLDPDTDPRSVMISRFEVERHI